MSWMRRIAEWLRAKRSADALAEEIEAHRAHVQDELGRAGLSREDAARESRRRMGNVLLAREDARDVWIARWADRLRQHLRYGLRGLVGEPAFALTAIATLGLGTAAMTTVFSVADGELWRPLPYPEPHRLLAVRSNAATEGRETDGIGIDELNEWRAAIPAFSALAAEGGSGRRAVRLDFTQSMSTTSVTANFFTTLGRTAIAGRVFTTEDARGSNAVVIGSRGWRRVFDGRPDLVGKTLFIDKEPHPVVGIVETDDSRGPEDDLFLPLDERSAAGRQTDEGTFFTVIGRLAHSATREVALAQTQAVLDRRGQINRARAGHIATVRDINEFYRVTDGRPLYFFLGASVLALALTIVNIAGLVLSRGLRRTPEFALRGALGGGGRAIAGQLVVEAALIAVPGCAFGLWLAAQAVGAVGPWIPGDLLIRGRHIVVDYRAAAVCVAVIAITMAGLALAPLGVARRADAAAAMAGGPRSSGLPSAGRTRERLLIAQLALTVVLLATGALFVKSFAAESRIPLGFDPADGWSMYVSLSDAKYSDAGLVRQYTNALLERTRAIPGVRDAAVATSSPLLSGFVVLLTQPGVPLAAGNAGTRTVYRAVSPNYFRAIATPITRGRGFLDSDVAGAPDVAVVNEQFAREVFRDENPIGRQVGITGARTLQVPSGIVTIVGVAANIKELRLNEAGIADIYVPFAQRPAPDIELLVRGNGASGGMPAQLRAAAGQTDPAVPVARVATLDRRVAVALQRDRFNLLLATGFSVVALVIAAIGIYGAMAYAAIARAREFGIRLALGASPAGLLRRALWHAARFGVIGAALGLFGAFAAAAWIGDALYLVPGKHNGLLYSVSTTDPIALGAAAAGVILIALVSGAIPARRLARIDPVTTLRAE
jgi:putative ABC transport system permease protein